MTDYEFDPQEFADDLSIVLPPGENRVIRWRSLLDPVGEYAGYGGLVGPSEIEPIMEIEPEDFDPDWFFPHHNKQSFPKDCEVCHGICSRIHDILLPDISINRNRGSSCV